MTNPPILPPEETPPSPGEHASAGHAVTSAGAPVSAPPQSYPPASLDEGTLSRLAEPRGRARLGLDDGAWHQISPRYIAVQLISTGSMLLVVVAAMVVVGVVLGQTWVFLPGGILTLILVWTLAILPRQARSIGYRLRRDDLVFRRGILWQRLVAVPYGRMQLIDITHGPLDRGFGIAQLKFVTAAAATGVVIPGLAQQAAEDLRDTLIEVAETRRTGL